MDTTTKTLEPTITQEPLVTIIMLTYNRAGYLVEAIASVIKQTYINWELVIIDDGSTDDTASIIAAHQDSRIRYIKHPENAGLHARRKESLSYCKGSYVAILDSDDVWTSATKLSTQISFLEDHDECVLVGTFSNLIDSSGKEIGTIKYETGDVTIREKILFRNQFTHSAVVMRVNTLKETIGYQPLLAEDLELFLQIGTKGTLANIPEYMTAHRVHEGSMNDHGIKMCSAVHTIIKSHRNYPHFKKAYIVSHVRLVYCRLKQLLQLFKQKS